MEDQLKNQVKQCLEDLNKAFTEKNLEAMADHMGRVVQLTTKSKNIEDFQFKMLYLENLHFITVSALNIGTNTRHSSLIISCLKMLSNLSLASEPYLNELSNLTF